MNCPSNDENNTVDSCTKLTKHLQTTIDRNVLGSDVLNAEIIWTLFSVTKGYSNNSAANLNPTLECMFPDSAVAANFHLGPDKLRYFTNWGIAPYMKEQLKVDIDKADYVSVSFDESLNENTQTCQFSDIGTVWRIK